MSYVTPHGLANVVPCGNVVNVNIETDEAPGIHIIAIAADERWEQEWRDTKSGRHTHARINDKGKLKQCTECGKWKDSSCFISHRNISTVSKPFPMCNACRTSAPDYVQKGTGRATRATHCAKGHEWTPENTGTRRDGRRWCKACFEDTKAKWVANATRTRA